MSKTYHIVIIPIIKGMVVIHKDNKINVKTRYSQIEKTFTFEEFCKKYKGRYLQKTVIYQGEYMNTIYPIEIEALKKLKEENTLFMIMCAKHIKFRKDINIGRKDYLEILTFEKSEKNEILSNDLY